MIDLNTQQLIFRANRWPWRWFAIFREAGIICQRAVERFDTLKYEHHLLKLESCELQKNRLADAERIQQLRDELQALKVENTEFHKQQLEMDVELKALKDERESVMTHAKRATKGSSILFEYIRRNKVNDDRGVEIPEMGPFTNIFKQ